MALESVITNNVIKYLNSIEGCKAEKLMGNAFQKNKPDINGCWRGKMFKIEMKSPETGYKPSKGQLLELRLWSKVGAVCFVAYSVEDVAKRINEERCE